MEEDKFITTKEAAAILGCHRHTVNDYLHRGILYGEHRKRAEWYVDREGVLRLKEYRELQGLRFRTKRK